MKRIVPYFILFVFLGGVSYAQEKKEQKTPVKTKSKTSELGIGVGMASSSVFLAQNVLNRNNALGYYANMVYGSTAKPFRLSGEYTHYNNINIAPTWRDIKANCTELNLHSLWRFRSVKSYLFLITGVSCNVFSGYFTGQNDFLNFSSVYTPNQIATRTWWGFNAGLGYEIYYKDVCAFATYKMRVGNVKQKSELNIMDVCMAFGLRYNVSFPSPSFKRIFRGTRSRYMLNT